jgi:hypothetical protein
LSKYLVRVAIFAAVVAVFSGVWLSLQPSLPNVPELDSVDLSLPKTKAPSAALRRLLTVSGKTTVTKDKVLAKRIAAKIGTGVVLDVPQSYQQAQDTLGFPLYQGRWLENPKRVLEQLASLQPPLDDFRQALYAPGCTPRSFLTSAKDVVSHPYFMQGTTLELVRGLALLQSGRIDDGVRVINALMDRLVALEQTCINDMMWALILSHQLNRVHSAYGFVLAMPQAARHHLAIWHRITQLERRAVRMDIAWKHEAEAIAKRLRKLADHTSFWSFSYARTIKPIRLLMKRRVLIAQTLKVHRPLFRGADAQPRLSSDRRHRQQ